MYRLTKGRRLYLMFGTPAQLLIHYPGLTAFKRSGQPRLGLLTRHLYILQYIKLQIFSHYFGILCLSKHIGI